MRWLQMKCNVCDLADKSKIDIVNDNLIYAFDMAWCVWHYEDMKKRL